MGDNVKRYNSYRTQPRPYTNRKERRRTKTTQVVIKGIETIYSIERRMKCVIISLLKC
jgi:hypothetical protein